MSTGLALRIGVDLASSTEIGLCRGLERAKWCSFNRPGMKNSEGITKHTVVEQSRFRGLRAISLVTNKLVIRGRV